MGLVMDVVELIVNVMMLLAELIMLIFVLILIVVGMRGGGGRGEADQGNGAEGGKKQAAHRTS